MDVVKSWDDNVPLVYSIASRQNTVDSSCSARLIRRVMDPLHLFDILVQELELFNELWSNIHVIGEVVVDQLLHQLVLDLGISGILSTVS